VVVLVGHALLLSGVSLDVDDIAYTIVDEICGELDGAMLCKESIIGPFQRIYFKS
jgi:hypothetical protein